MFTIEKTGSAEQTIHKSRFIAFASACQSEIEVGAFLRAIAAQHNSAGHLAYAFRVKAADGIIGRFSDAGEPSGTPGKPILQMLEGQQLINVAVGVIRYYGGVNLGTGNLARLQRHCQNGATSLTNNAFCRDAVVNIRHSLQTRR